MRKPHLPLISNTSILSTGTLLVSGGIFTEGQGLLSVTGAGPAALSVTSGAFNLSGGAVMVTNGASFTGGTETISGGTFTAGTIAFGGGGITQSGGTITSNGATTFLGGTYTINAAGAAFNTASLGLSNSVALSQSAGTITVSGAANFNGGSGTISGGAFNAGTLSVGNTAARTLTLSGGVTTVNGVTTIAGGSTGNKIIMSGGSLSAVGGISFAGASNFGTLTGNGTISGGAISGIGGTIAAAGGVLDIGNAISSGPILTIGTTAGSVLKLDGTVTSASAITIANANQTLEIGATGALTIGVTQNVNLGTIKLDGGTLTDASGISLGAAPGGTGKLSGFGTVAANLTKFTGSGANTIIASGGTLDLTGTFGAGLVAVINPGSDLKFDNTATSSAAISMIDNTQTLEIGASGALTIGAKESVTGGTIMLDHGSLTDILGLSIGTGASLTGFGKITGGTDAATDFEGAGTVTATGGALEFTTATNLFAAGTQYHIGDVSGSILRFDSTVGTTASQPTVTFDGASTPGLGTLDLTKTSLANFHAIVNNFAIGDTIDMANADHVTLTGGTTLNVFDASNVSLGSITLGGTHAGAHFFVNDSTGAITTDQPCYAAGTRILTAIGERPVECLMQGDIVLTLAGEELSAQPVKWVGHRRIDLTAHSRPETVAPIRIRRGAFAEAMPHRDLLLSPDHAVFVDGKLICARQLINGTTIRQEKGGASVEYFHVELDAHAILLAEGLPAESYLNTGNRGFFANAGEPLVLHPDMTDETDYSMREAGSCAPFVSDEASVRPVWQRLAERAAALGQPVPRLDTTTDPDLRIVAKGRTVRPLYGENGLYIFVLPKGATEVRLVSRSGAPADARPWLDDRRCLGVNVERIVLRGANELQEIPVDHPGLSQGWHAVEHDGVALRRWTSGEALLPLPALGGPTMLEIRASNGGMAYVTSADQERRAA